MNYILPLLFCIVHYNFAMSAKAPPSRIVDVVCDGCEKSFANTWAYERHRTCYKLRGTKCYSLETQKSELLATRRGNLSTAMLSRAASRRHRGCDIKLNPKISKCCQILLIICYLSYFAYFDAMNARPGRRDPVGCKYLFQVFCQIYWKLVKLRLSTYFFREVLIIAYLSYFVYILYIFVILYILVI